MASSPGPKIALVTGCSSGFGREMVLRFLKSGTWRVIATTRQAQDIDLPTDHRLVVLRLDIAKEHGRKELQEYLEANCKGGLDCLINNAGYGVSGPLETATDEQIRAQFEVNFFAPLFLIRDLLPQLRKAGGRIINISSVLGFVGMPMQSLYVASKFALEGLSESLHYELASHGISITLVEPGGYRTGFARNLDWPDENHRHASIYKDGMHGYRSFLHRVSNTGKGKDPADVANVVFEIANAKDAPLRRRVGLDCHALYFVRRSLPQRAADFVFRRVTGKIIETK